MLTSTVLPSELYRKPVLNLETVQVVSTCYPEAHPVSPWCRGANLPGVKVCRQPYDQQGDCFTSSSQYFTQCCQAYLSHGLLSETATGTSCSVQASPDIAQRRGSGGRAAGTSHRDSQQPICGGQQADTRVQCTVSQEQCVHVPQHGNCGADEGPVVPTIGDKSEAWHDYNGLQDSDRPSEAGIGAQPMQPHWPWWLSYPPPPPPPPPPPFFCPPFRLLPAEDAQWHHGMW